MASQVHFTTCQAGSFAGAAGRPEGNHRQASVADPEPLEKFTLADGDCTDSALTPEVLALGVEFVALPGKAAKLQKVIPEAMRETLGKFGGFSGCMVLVSEQEARLVTVLTLWTGRDRVEQCNENFQRVERLVTPYVDRFLRTRRLAAFMSTR